MRYDDADGAPVDEVAKLDPDLILATNSGITEEEYKKLSKIAPVVAYPEAPWVTPWQDSLDMVGKALGRSSLADEVEAETAGGDRRRQGGVPRRSRASRLSSPPSPPPTSPRSASTRRRTRAVSLMHDLGHGQRADGRGASSRRASSTARSPPSGPPSSSPTSCSPTVGERGRPGDVHRRQADRPDPRASRRATPTPRTDKHVGLARDQPDAAVDPVRHRAVRARGRRGGRRHRDRCPRRRRDRAPGRGPPPAGRGSPTAAAMLLAAVAGRCPCASVLVGSDDGLAGRAVVDTADPRPRDRWRPGSPRTCLGAGGRRRARRSPAPACRA